MKAEQSVPLTVGVAVWRANQRGIDGVDRVGGGYANSLQ